MLSERHSFCASETTSVLVTTLAGEVLAASWAHTGATSKTAAPTNTNRIGVVMISTSMPSETLHQIDGSDSHRTSRHEGKACPAGRPGKIVDSRGIRLLHPQRNREMGQGGEGLWRKGRIANGAAGSSGLVETLPFARQLRQQSRGFPETRIPVGIGGEALHAVDDLVQSHLVGVEHRPAPVKGKTVAGQVDHVDVGGTP